jgi:hypothetical protein
LLDKVDKQIARPIADRVQSPTVNPHAFDLVKEIPRSLLLRVLNHPNPPFNGSEGAKVPALSLSAAQLSPRARQALSQLVSFYADYLQQRRPEMAALRQIRQDAADPRGLRIDFWCNKTGRSVSSASLMLHVRSPVGGLGDIELAFGGGTSGSEDEPTLTPDPDPHDAIRFTLAPNSCRHDRALADLGAAAKIDIVADYYTKGTVLTITPGMKRLGEFLSSYDRIYRTRHWWVGNTLFVRSRSWYNLIEAEPTVSVTDRLDKLVLAKDTPTFKDLVSIVSESTDEQLSTLEYYFNAEAVKLPPNWSPRLQMNAPWLRAYANSTEQQRALIHSRGLSIGALPNAHRERWERPLAIVGMEYTNNGVSVKAIQGSPPDLASWPGLPRIIASDGARTTDLWRNAESY